MQRDGIISAVPPNLVNPAHQAFIVAKTAASSAAPRGWDEKPCFSHSPHRQYIIITIIYQIFCVNIHGQDFHKFNCFTGRASMYSKACVLTPSDLQQKKDNRTQVKADAYQVQNVYRLLLGESF